MSEPVVGRDGDGGVNVVVEVGGEELLRIFGREKVEVIEPCFPSFLDTGAGSDKRLVSFLDSRLAGFGTSFTGAFNFGAGLAIRIILLGTFILVASGTGFLRIDLILGSIFAIILPKNECEMESREGEVTKITDKRDDHVLPLRHLDRREEGSRMMLLIGILG
jgi:hypothetical protein